MADEKNLVFNDEAPPPINIINFDSYRSNSSNNRWSHHEIVEEDDEDYSDDDDDDGVYKGSKSLPTIIEEYENGISGDMFPYGKVSDVVYVVTWKGTEELLSVSMDALRWTLGKRLLHESTMVYLVHVFPELRFIPTPLGRLPINQVNPEQKERYLIQERSKRSEYLQKFLSICSSSKPKVHVETVLIESDMEAKAILDLIPILNIRKLVLGATKSSVRKLKSSSKRGSGGGTLEQIVYNAPQFCEVKVICEGKEVSLQEQLTSGPPSPSSTAPSQLDVNVDSQKTMQVQQDKTVGFVNFSCFKL